MNGQNSERLLYRHKRKWLVAINIVVWMLVLTLSVHSADNPLQSVKAYIMSIAWSPDSSMIAVGYGTGQCVLDRPDLYIIEILNADTNQVINTLQAGDCAVVALDWSPDGNKLASASLDAVGIRIWDVASGQLLVTKQHNLQGSLDVSWQPDGNNLAITDYGEVVMILDIRTGEIISEVARGTVVDWNPDGSKVVSGTDSENDIFVTDVATGKKLLTLSGHTESIQAVDWSPDGTKLASGSNDHTVRIWDAKTGDSLLTLIGHTDFVTNVIWSPDSRWLASSSSDGTIRIWDASTGKQLALIEGSAGIFTLAWKPDGKQLAYGAEYGTLAVIAVPLLPTATPTLTPTPHV